MITTGEWVSASNFETQGIGFSHLFFATISRNARASCAVCQHFRGIRVHQPRTTDRKCSDELPINWFYARAINGGKEGFKLGIDLGIYQQGKEGGPSAPRGRQDGESGSIAKRAASLCRS